MTTWSLASVFCDTGTDFNFQDCFQCKTRVGLSLGVLRIKEMAMSSPLYHRGLSEFGELRALFY